ncbi:MAG TPA: hypothetical protein VGG39_23575 [Polyangiaceae bacterium]
MTKPKKTTQARTDVSMHVYMPERDRRRIKARAAMLGVSLNGFCVSAIIAKVRSGAKDEPDVEPSPENESDRAEP